MTSGLPFDDFRALLAAPRPMDEKAAEGVRLDFRRYAEAGGSLGRLEELAVWLAGWSGRPRPMVLKPAATVLRRATSRLCRKAPPPRWLNGAVPAPPPSASFARLMISA
jgi:NaMN:DMB phosphoribosyltransferase